MGVSSVIRIDAASVATISVTIQALKIGRKQMTQSVFRQLKDEAPYDLENLKLKGVVWGWVNYHWGICEVRYGHRHLVWQLGDELRRATVVRDLSYGDYSHISKNDHDQRGLVEWWGRQFDEIMASCEQLFIAV